MIILDTTIRDGSYAVDFKFSCTDVAAIISKLERLVSAYLDLAEMQAMRHIPMTMEDWEKRLNGFLELWDHEVLKDNEKISVEMSKIHAETEFEKYRIIQDRKYVSDFDELLLNSNKYKKDNNN